MKHFTSQLPDANFQLLCLLKRCLLHTNGQSSHAVLYDVLSQSNYLQSFYSAAIDDYYHGLSIVTNLTVRLIRDGQGWHWRQEREASTLLESQAKQNIALHQTLMCSFVIIPPLMLKMAFVSVCIQYSDFKQHNSQYTRCLWEDTFVAPKRLLGSKLFTKLINGEVADFFWQLHWHDTWARQRFVLSQRKFD